MVVEVGQAQFVPSETTQPPNPQNTPVSPDSIPMSFQDKQALLSRMLAMESGIQGLIRQLEGGRITTRGDFRILQGQVAELAGSVGRHISTAYAMTEPPRINGALNGKAKAT